MSNIAVSVNTVGKARMAPTMIRFGIGFIGKGQTSDEAINSLASKVEMFMRRLDDNNIGRDKIKLSGSSLAQRSKRVEKTTGIMKQETEWVFSHYEASQRGLVELPFKKETVSGIIAALMMDDEGISSHYDFGITEKEYEVLEREAVADAVRQANDKMTHLAECLGMKEAVVKSISYDRPSTTNVDTYLETGSTKRMKQSSVGGVNREAVELTIQPDDIEAYKHLYFEYVITD